MPSEICPRCGSPAKDYALSPCDIWGNWHPWHDSVEGEILETAQTCSICNYQFTSDETRSTVKVLLPKSQAWLTFNALCMTCHVRVMQTPDTLNEERHD